MWKVDKRIVEKWSTEEQEEYEKGLMGLPDLGSELELIAIEMGGRCEENPKGAENQGQD